jgi:hypothetical protein
MYIVVKDINDIHNASIIYIIKCSNLSNSKCLITFIDLYMAVLLMKIIIINFPDCL